MPSDRHHTDQSRLLRDQLTKWCAAVDGGDFHEASFRAHEVGVLVQLFAITPRFGREWAQRGGGLASASPKDIAAAVGTLLAMLAEASDGPSPPAPGIPVVPWDNTPPN
jgi:hypothetical protein